MDTLNVRITCIAVHPTDHDRVWVSMGGFYDGLKVFIAIQEVYFGIILLAHYLTYQLIVWWLMQTGIYTQEVMTVYFIGVLVGQIGNLL